MKGFSSKAPTGSGEEYRLVKLYATMGSGNPEPAKVVYGPDGKPQTVFTLERAGYQTVDWVELWGPLVTADNDYVGSLQEAQQRVKLAMDSKKKMQCPCCGKSVSPHRKRALNDKMAEFLVLLVRRFRATKGQWVHTDTIDSRGGDYAKLRHWGLIENKPNDDPSKSSSGFWRPTQKGIDFVDRKISVPSHIHLAAKSHAPLMPEGLVLGFTDSRVYIDDVPNFDYLEVLNG